MSHKITLLEEITGSGNLVSVRQNIFNLLYFFFFPPLASTCTTPADSVAQIPPRSLPPSERRPACSCCSPRRRLLPVSCRVNFEQYIHAINTSKGVCAKKVVFHKFSLEDSPHASRSLCPSVSRRSRRCRVPSVASYAKRSLPPRPRSILPRSSRAWSSRLKSRGRGSKSATDRSPPACARQPVGVSPFGLVPRLNFSWCVGVKKRARKND